MPDQPPYLAVADRLRQRIAGGEWLPGDRLPSRAQLGAEYQVGDNVIRRAQELLISQGVLTGRAGSGTYVAEPRERLRLVRSSVRGPGGGSRYRSEMAALGKSGSWEHQSQAKVPAPPEIAARLGIDEGDHCVLSTYEFLADGKPVMLSTSWEPYGITGGTIVVLPENGPYAGRGVVERMAAIDITVDRAVEQPEPRQATAEEANLLGITKTSQVTHIRRTYLSTDGRAVETADIIVPAASCELVYEMPIDRP
jgi:GntR family transcriptional regulator